MDKTALALDALLTRHRNLYSGKNVHGLPIIELESPWPSPCVVHNEGSDYFWQHTDKKNKDLFLDLEKALELNFHQDIKSFYTAFWSNGIQVEHSLIDFALIQTWNEEDQEHLKENILGHCFAKMKARLPLTIFIGSTESNEVVVVDNNTGEVLLERPGRKAHKILSSSLECFLLELTPTLKAY